MATVLVLAPMRTELAPIVRHLDLHRDRHGDSAPATWSGPCGAFAVIVAMAGIGTRRSAEVAESMIGRSRPDHVVIAGVAGGLSPELGVGDVVVPAVVRDLDAGTSHAAHRLGDLEPAGEVVTSNALHGWDVLEPHARAGVLAVDMETSAVAAVCERAAVPWTAIRALSDVVRDATVDSSTLGLVREDGSTDLGGVARYLARHPGRVRRLATMGRDARLATSAVAVTLRDALLSAPR